MSTGNLRTYTFRYTLPDGRQGQTELTAESLAGAWKQYASLLGPSLAPRSVVVEQKR